MGGSHCGLADERQRSRELQEQQQPNQRQRSSAGTRSEQAELAGMEKGTGSVQSSIQQDSGGLEGRKIRTGEKHRTETARGVPSSPIAPHKIVGGEIEINAGEGVSGSSLSQGTFPSP